MSNTILNDIDEYFRSLNAKIGNWPSERRLALAAGMAERWLHVYDSFSAEEQWGDPGRLRRSLDAAWNHLEGKTLSPADLARHLGLVEENTPHMDDFDDTAALAVCYMVREAVACCGPEDNTAPAIQAVLSGFEAVLPFWEEELDAQPRPWKQTSVRSELEKQRKLVAEIEALGNFDSAAINGLRKTLQREEFQGAVAPAAKTPAGPVRVTNQWAFERFRSIIELDLKSSSDNWWEEHAPGSTLWAVMLFSAWSGRYGRRRQIIDGVYGKLVDIAGMQALQARNRALDGTVSGIPNWGSELDEAIQMTLQNPSNGLDVTAPKQPHSYGPSFRRLWIEGEQTGSQDQDAWQSILDWANHRPAVWEQADQRKTQGLTHNHPELGAWLAREIAWSTTDEPEYPWTALADGDVCQIRLNDFPDAILYSLLINGEPHGDFHDWPETWSRDGNRGAENKS